MFNRQLRIHRENPAFEVCFQKTNDISAQALMGIWAEALGLQTQTYLAGLVLKLSLENFYLQITDETLNHQWLTRYFQEIQRMVSEFRKTEKLSTLDGSV